MEKNKTKGRCGARFLLMAVLFMCTVACRAQEADASAGRCINEERWFELRDIYRADSSRMSPFIRLFSKTMLCQMFNRLADANENILALVRNHQKEMGMGNVCSMIMLYADNCSRLGDNAGAASALRRFAVQVEQTADSGFVAELHNREKMYASLAQYRLYDITGGDCKVPFRMVEVSDSAQALMFVDGKLNARAARMVFDTGAGYNVVTPEAARRYGMRIVAGHVLAEGTRRNAGSVAVADSLCIGQLVVRNAVFAVLDMSLGNERAAKMVSSLDIILGQPLLRQFGKYAVSFADNSITLTRNSQPVECTSNVCMRTTPVVEAESGGRSIALTLDTGAPGTMLGNAFYRDFSAEVAREGRWDIVPSAGYGGVGYDSVFRLPKVNMSVGGKTFALDNVPVSAMSTGNALTEGYGRLGIDFFRMWKKVTVDNVNMTIAME